VKKINTKIKNEKAIAQSIKKWYSKHGYNPSFRDLAELTGLSVSTVHEICVDLRIIGIIEFQDNVARTIKLKEK
jgi:DNA-binding IclR family transcriptional regulator